VTGKIGPDWDKYPMWVKAIPGFLGAAWLIGGLSYVLRTRLASPSLSTLGKTVFTGVCLSGIAFAVSAMWPFQGQEQVRRGDMGNFWSFVRGPAPEASYKRALWGKMRRTMAIWLLGVLFLVAGAFAGAFGLLHR
jgi:hypothetical protein